MLAGPLRTGHLWCLVLGAALAVPRHATGESLGTEAGFDLRLDTTVRVSLGLRTEPADTALLDAVNADDGDRAFTPGLESERVDVVSELTGERDRLGFDISAQGWYDAAYNTQSANTSPATFNPINASYRGFTPDVRALMGRQAELLNAYVRDTFDAGAVPVTVSIGRQTLLWGESLLFADNGIAAAQAPVDEIKSQSSPLAEARELFLPVTQIVVRAALGDGVSLEAYDQLEWRRDRLPGVGSFFSTTDLLDQGGQRFLPAGGIPELYRTGDSIPHGIGQFGLALRQTGGAIDWGVYALEADARSPVLVLDPASTAYHLDFPRGTNVYGASLSGYAGDANIAGEISLHQHTPLDAVASPGGSLGGGGPVYAAADLVVPPPPPIIPPHPAIGRGTSLNAQASLQDQLPPGFLADGAILQAELAGNALFDGAVPAGRSRLAVASRAVLTLQYFHVVPGVDLAAPLGFGVGLAGRSAVNAAQTAGAGFVSLGLNAVFHVVWQGGISFTHFVGGPGAQPLADRDFATLTVSRTF